MNFTSFYNKKFFSNVSGTPISTSRAEWESAPCIIDMTRVTDEEMRKFASKLYLEEGTGEVKFDEAETWLMTNTKAKYLEDYSEKEREEYGKRAKKLYYKK